MKSQSLMAALSVLTVNMLLSLFFPAALSGDDCGGQTPALNITAPERLEALSGSCLQIPCRYDTTDTRYDSSKPIYGVWRKTCWERSDCDIFHSRGSVNIYPLNLTGDLKNKDCTTLFPDLNTSYAGKYFFRIENDPFKASACADSVQITVKESAWSPSIKVSGDLKDLKEEESVSISCSARTPCPLSPPELTWSLQQVSQRQTETNPDGTITTKIQENMTLSDTHDGSNITCSVRYPVDGGKRNKTAETNLTLSVSYAPKDTSASISPSGLVSAGSWVELSCSSRAKPPVRTFTWFRNNKRGPVLVSEGQVYGFNFTDGGGFFCVAANNLGNQTSPVVHLSLDGFPYTHILLAVLSSIILLICLIVSVWCLKFKRRAPQQTQSQVYEDIAVQDMANAAEEELHYGDVTFIRSRPGASSDSEQDGKQQETVYADVKVARPGNSPEDLYAEVKKK